MFGSAKGDPCRSPPTPSKIREQRKQDDKGGGMAAGWALHYLYIFKYTYSTIVGLSVVNDLFKPRLLKMSEMPQLK